MRNNSDLPFYGRFKMNCETVEEVTGEVVSAAQLSTVRSVKFEDNDKNGWAEESPTRPRETWIVKGYTKQNSHFALLIVTARVRRIGEDIVLQMCVCP